MMNAAIRKYLPLLLFSMFLFIRCADDKMELRAEPGEEFSGGRGTHFTLNSNAFGSQHDGLTDEQSLNFFVGNSLFNQNWVSAPASTTARDGLGPLFNATSCSGCHFKDGRGRPPEYPGERSHGLLLRLGMGNDVLVGPIPDPNYGGQLQDNALLGIEPEADFEVGYEEIPGEYPDGTPYSLRKPTYTIFNMMEGGMEAANISPRVANHMVGMGLLEAIDEATVLSFADESDADGNGISGRPNYVWDVESRSTRLGRFGWKANQPSIRQQVAAAFAGDMGITSSLFPETNCPPSLGDCDDIPDGGTPEINDENFDHTVLYSSSLAVPGRRDWEAHDVLAGKALFVEANCSGCHIPKITTGTHPTFSAFNQEVIYPYTDLLLHDMGPGLADNSPDFLANGQEWRTPPLWGIGLFDFINKHTFLMHDGRARNMEEAILWHGGEAEASKNTFMKMTKAEREQLILFLESL